MASARNSGKPRKNVGTAEEDVEPTKQTRRPPARTPEARELELGALAYDLAEVQLREGTASAPVLVHFLKIVSERDKLEMEGLRRQNDLLSKKADAVVQADRIEEITNKAVESMRVYQGHEVEVVDDYDD